MRTDLNSVARLFLAGAKDRPFRGWAAKIVSWSANSRPDLKFGSWEQSSSYKRPGGTVILAGVAPGEIVLFGANSTAMRSKDKFTHFGRVMRVDDGSLTIWQLVDGTLDARQEWLKPPLVKVPSEIAVLALTLLSEVSIRGKVNELQCISDAISAVLRAGYFSSRILRMDGQDFLSVANKLSERLLAIKGIHPDIEPISFAYDAWLENWLIQRAARPRRMAFGAAGSPHGGLNEGVLSASAPSMTSSDNPKFTGNRNQVGGYQNSSKISRFLLSAQTVVL